MAKQWSAAIVEALSIVPCNLTMHESMDFRRLLLSFTAVSK